MDATGVIALFGLLICASASFFFALAETSLFALGRWQVRHLQDRNGAKGRLVAELLEDPHELLATIVLGNTVANAALVTIAIALVVEMGWSAWATLAGAVLVILVPGELIPKTMAARTPENWALRLAFPMRWFLRVSRPIHRIALWSNTQLIQRLVPASFKPLTDNSTEEYRELLEMACQQGAMGQSEREIILQIVALDQRTAKDVMRPRSMIHCLPDDLSVEEMIAAAKRLGHRRIPLYDASPDTIVGVLNTRALLLEPHGDLSEAIEFPSFVPESANLLQLLKSLQRQNRGLAIVLDEFGGTAGLVSMEDILGAVIGRIRAEGKAEGFVMEKLAPGKWRVHGTMRIEDFRREYPALGEVPGVETLGGLLVMLAEVVPPPGFSILYKGLKLTARLADQRRVKEVLIETVKAGASEGGLSS